MQYSWTSRSWQFIKVSLNQILCWNSHILVFDLKSSSGAKIRNKSSELCLNGVNIPKSTLKKYFHTIYNRGIKKNQKECCNQSSFQFSMLHTRKIISYLRYLNALFII